MKKIIGAAVGFAGGSVISKAVGVHPVIGGLVGGVIGYMVMPEDAPVYTSPVARAFVQENVKRAEAGLAPLQPEQMKIPPTGGPSPMMI